MPNFATHFRKRYYISLLVGWVSLYGGLASQQKIDSTKIYSIPEIVVTEQYRNTEVKSTAPLQILSQQKIQKLNALQVADAAKHFSGVMVRDYGGIGGLKTISVRSLGANHTAVSYDGITLTDCQTGQIDIGRFSLENIKLLSLSNGQGDNIFLPARHIASASVLNIQTLTPKFEGNKLINSKLSFKIGSFGLINPSLWLEGKIGKKFSSSFGAEWLAASGNYPYTLKYGLGANDSTSSETRQNTDVNNLRLEGALFATFSEKESAYLKTYFFQSERGLPGATILYNAESSSKQRIWDKTFFTQAHYEKEFSRSFVFQTNAKYNNGFIRYLDPTYLNADEKLENSYLQQEYYGSVSVLYRAFNNMSFSAATDGTINTLETNLADFATPTRYSLLTSVAAKYVSNKLLATASLLGTSVIESVKIGTAARNQQHLSPYVSISVSPFSSNELRARVFYKNIFRLPSFNDLYYTQVGSRLLNPEKTHQYNLGFTYTKNIAKWLPQLSITLDGYHNQVTDKIVAYPNKGTFFWTILNLGKVEINGLDFTTEANLVAWEKTVFVLGATYTYQRALNVTDPTDGTYMHQLPYTPRISGSGKAGFESPWINLSYSVLWSGHRYAVNQNYAENRLPGYAEHSISAFKTFQTKHFLLSTNLEVLNLLNENYAVIKWFPMPGRSFRATISIKF